MKSKKRNLIKFDLSKCKNWNECMTVIDMVASGRVRVNAERLNEK